MRVRGVERNVLFLESCGEERTKFARTVGFGVILYEEFNKISVAFFITFACLVHCFLESRCFGVVAGQVLHYIRHRNLEDDVHTSFKVQAQSDLQRLTFFQRLPVQINLLVHHRVEVSLAGHRAHSFSFSLVMIGYEGKREIEEANQR